MSWIFCVSVFTPVGVKSSRTANPVMAFAKANHFPSAIACWEVEGNEAMVHSASFNNREELNRFFDYIRRGYPTDMLRDEYDYSYADSARVKEYYDEVRDAHSV